MPRFNVEHKGKWACFSGIVDEFITEFSSKEKHEEWRILEYGRCNYQPTEECNMKTLEDCAFCISLNHDIEDAINNFAESGLDEEDFIELLENEYTKRKEEND